MQQWIVVSILTDCADGACCRHRVGSVIMRGMLFLNYNPGDDGTLADLWTMVLKLREATFDG